MGEKGRKMFQLDHIIVSVGDLDAAMQDYRALGFTVIYGGRHASGSTHNGLIVFQDGTIWNCSRRPGKRRSPARPTSARCWRTAKGWQAMRCARRT